MLLWWCGESSALWRVSRAQATPRFPVGVRHLWNKTTHEVQFYLTSLESDAHKQGQAIRLHWGIENGLHWTLDVTFKEDDCRVRTGHGPQNLAILRRIALNALNP